MSNKGLSKFALESNCNRISERVHSVYLWTFTTADSPEPEECALRWKKAISQLTRKIEFYGVRVFEMHPGGHGMHVHLVTPQRFDVNDVRSITSRCGFGRIHVKRIPSKSASYVAKYVGKQNGKGLLPKGVRAWGIVGRKFFGDCTRVSDCVLFCPTRERYRFMCLLCPPSSPRQSLGLYRLASLVQAGFLRLRHSYLDASGFDVEVNCVGWRFHLSPNDDFGFDSSFSADEAIL